MIARCRGLNGGTGYSERLRDLLQKVARDMPRSRATCAAGSPVSMSRIALRTWLSVTRRGRPPRSLPAARCLLIESMMRSRLIQCRRCDRRQVQQHHASAGPFPGRPDRGSRRGRADDQIALPVTGNGAILNLRRPVRDHHHLPELLRAKALRPLLAPYYPSRPQCCRNFQSQRSAALNIESTGRSFRATRASADPPDASP